MPCSLTRRAIALTAFFLLAGSVSAAEQPNVLWLTAEDHGPHVGAYGDPYASTPVIDKLAARGMLYRHAWSTAPVCAPARTTLISGLYPPSTGSQHMRSMTRLPPSMKMYPQYLREAGYYVTNNAKEDYNLEKPGQVWDESSQKAHWRNRKRGQPFFAIFNFTQSHESQIRTRPHKQVHDPARVRIPAYHPDTPEVRQDWAQYYDKISEVDALAGHVLSQLEEDGLAADTIVFYYSDHGSGMPRSKRWTYNSGLQVPVIVYFPEKWRHLAPAEYKPGGESKRLIGFIDFAPTLLSICGLAPPAHMQGRAFAGAHAQPGPRYQFAFRDRMDERIDMSRAVREERYVYIRNFQPHRIYGQHLAYMFETPTTRVWKALFDQGKLNLAQQAFWQEKPPEELYDIEADPDEVRNLARDKAHSGRLQRLRAELREWQINIRDLGLLPEGEIHSRAGGGSPYEMGQDQKQFPVRRILHAAENASSLASGPTVEQLRKGFTDADSAVRYWAAMGALMRKGQGVTALRRELNEALLDHAPFVRIVAAETLGRYGGAAEAEKALEVLLQLAPVDKNGLHVSVAALNAIYYLGPKAVGANSRIESLPRKSDAIPARLGDYVPRLIADILADL